MSLHVRCDPGERAQLDLFRSMPGEIAPRDAQDLMSWPFFSLAKRKRTAPIEFRMGETWISVEAVPEHGMATIWDADVLIWAASQIVQARDAGRATSRLMMTTPHEILAFTGRSIGRDLLPVASLNSVTLLGAEIVGRAYGGGLLKMEPREADLLPVPSLDHIKSVETELRAIKPQLAKHLRHGDVEAAVQSVDAILLAEVAKGDLKALRAARDVLFQRRRARGKNGEDRRSS